MIVSKLISGLGNQLFQYAIGRKLSLKRGVPLRLDVSFYEDQDLRSYKLHHYPVEAALATDDEMDEVLHIYRRNNLYTRLHRRVERKLPKHLHRHYRQSNWWQYEPEVLKISSKAYIEGYWQHYKYFEDIANCLYKELSVPETERLPFAAIYKEVTNNSQAVSVHVRRGDYVSDKNANSLMGVLPVNYYLSAIRHMRENVKDAYFYFFSDDLDWVKDNVQTDANCEFVEAGTDYIELDLMSQCRHNVIANSSFSWWGAFLNQNPEKIVVAPRQWVIPPAINNQVNIQFPSWTLL
jgi:hypothetical protein